MAKPSWKPKMQLVNAGRMTAAALTEEARIAGPAKNVGLEKFRFPVRIAGQRWWKEGAMTGVTMTVAAITEEMVNL